MTANKHYTTFTEKQTKKKINTDCYESREKRKKQLEVKGNGGFIFNTWSKSECVVNQIKKCIRQGKQKHFRAGNVLFFDSWLFLLELILLRKETGTVLGFGLVVEGQGVTGLLPHWEHAVKEEKSVREVHQLFAMALNTCMLLHKEGCRGCESGKRGGIRPILTFL